MKRLLISLILGSLITAFNSNAEGIVVDKKINVDLEIVAVQNYANYWVYIGEHQELFEKYVKDHKPHQINKGFALISLAGVKNKGFEEVIRKDGKNIKHTFKDSIVKFLEGKKFRVECSDIIDNMPKCIVHINKDTSFNQYLLMKGVSKYDAADYVPDDIRERFILAESYAKSNTLGVWTPFYGILEDF